MNVDGRHGRLNVDDGGDAGEVPVVLVHGNGANLTQWRAQTEHLRPSRRVVAFDLHGMGKSEYREGEDYSLQAMADDIDDVCDALGIGRFILVGHSFGGSVVAAYAARSPDRVAGVVFADAAGTVKVSSQEREGFLTQLRDGGATFVEQWFAPILKDAKPEVRRLVLDSAMSTPTAVMSGAMRSTLEFDARAALAAYPGPKFAIAAAPLEQPASLHLQFPEITVRRMKGVSHWLMMDEPREFNGLLDEALTTFDLSPLAPARGDIQIALTPSGTITRSDIGTI